MTPLLALAACRPDPGVEQEASAMSLVGLFDLTTERPTSLVLTVAGPEGTRDITFPGATTQHHVPILGNRADTTYDVTAALTDPDGLEVQVDPWSFTTGPLPAGLPTLRVAVADPDRMEPGLTLMPPVHGDLAFLLAVDAEGEPVYVAPASPEVITLTRTAAGELAMVDGTTLLIRAVTGEEVVRWTSVPVAPTDVAVPFPDFHHELVPQPDGTVWALAYEHTTVPDYPASYDAIDQLAPATIRNDLVVHLDRDGTVLAQFAMLDLLDHHHIGFGSLEPARSGALDWVHANALQYDAATDELTLSLRHQDAVVRFSAGNGALKWIFGSPEGWGTAFQPYLLTPTTPFTWPTHQHGIQVDPDGTLRMFDNGNDLRDTPYRASGELGAYSRLLEVQVDEAAGTVSPGLAVDDTTLGRPFCGAYGNDDRLPLTGNRLGTWALEGLVAEFAPDGAEIWELQLGSDWRVDRAIRVPSLYPDDVTVSWR